jgi:ligand-binding SRPBCC domain-containing protein
MAHLFKLRESITIHAPIERCFLLSTHLGIVQDELRMRPVATTRGGRAEAFAGLVTAGDTVLWRGWKFGLPHFHESLIEDFDRPRFFRDRMISGRFRSFEHDHTFEKQGSDATLLTDELRFTMPFGSLGDLAAAFFLAPHIHSLMRRRFQRIQRIAEGEEWRQYLQSSPG